MEQLLGDLASEYTGSLEDLVSYLIARSHLQGFSVTCTSGRMKKDSDDLSSIYLLCSARGFSCTERAVSRKAIVRSKYESVNLSLESFTTLQQTSVTTTWVH